ncbi:DUF6090 family protein [Winogradskyella alexanderae]|uniref:Uncharacterized protein n=1 Tax=Winogradskyella alexanderae TaxID=2877123 RepID=A0ABS7XUW9_9FLAO|nr:DUF6090 family protein [Winogradskyella alexanderae]MCA0133803.1 hypothetical protein [Winogradskyella alexanderae]
MIKFFRHIRKSLLEQNQMGKYFKYAIGEILLVVIGILIALQINNWNERRKATIEGLVLLENIYEDIKYNLDKIDFVYAWDSTQNDRNKKLIQLLFDQNSTYHDSLEIYFGSVTRYEVFSPRRTAYETLKTKGLELIRNKTLRSKITELYDEVYVLNDMVLEFRKEIHLKHVPIFNNRFLTLDEVEYKVPIDFNSLKNDKKFINTLSYILAESDNFLEHHNNMRAQTKQLRDIIFEELKSHD